MLVLSNFHRLWLFLQRKTYPYKIWRWIASIHYIQRDLFCNIEDVWLLVPEASSVLVSVGNISRHLVSHRYLSHLDPVYMKCVVLDINCQEHNAICNSLL